MYYYPQSSYTYWIKLEKLTNRKLVQELIQLIRYIGLNELIVLNENNQPWISNFTRNRTDFQALKDAVQYFDEVKVGKKFNGALQIELDELEKFLHHFYCLTVYDGGFGYFNISDAKQDLLLFIHYDGEVKLTVLVPEKNEVVLKAIQSTSFIDAMREDSDRFALY